MRVLIADDDTLSRRILEDSLSKWGYEVVVTRDGNEAWDYLQRDDTPNLVVLDWVMPGLDGIDICRKLRDRIARNYFYIILLTAKAGREDIIKGLESGADDYIIKPFNYDELRYRMKIGQRIVELEKRILGLAQIDYLTGLLNRRAFMERLDLEVNRVARKQQALSLVILDIDHFKNVNDSFGHQAGDLVLQETARCLSATCRIYDIIGRYGGEEYIICLPETNAEQALLAAERVRAAIASQKTLIPEFMQYVNITASFGVSTLSYDNEICLDTLINRADSALYQAKEKGRNQVVAFQVMQ